MNHLSKETVRFFTVGAEDAGQRLDNCLLRLLKGVPKSHVQRIIRSGEVRINKKRCKGSDRLQEGDTVRIPPVRTATRTEQKSVPPGVFDIIYEDDVLLVIDKPSGTAVHGGSGLSFGVIEQLRRARPEAPYLELVHRLDRDTSGLLMIAKKRSALVKMHDMLRNNHPQKHYLALCAGDWPDRLRHVRLPLIKYQGAQGEKMVRPDEAGSAAHTGFRVCERFSGAAVNRMGLSAMALVEADLKTGRTHQIRVHMQSQQFPIAGDERYGDYRTNKILHKNGLKRMFLHAARLRFPHPVTGTLLELTAPLPAELEDFLTGLRLQELPAP